MGQQMELDLIFEEESESLEKTTAALKELEETIVRTIELMRRMEDAKNTAR